MLVKSMELSFGSELGLYPRFRKERFEIIVFNLLFGVGCGNYIFCQYHFLHKVFSRGVSFPGIWRRNQVWPDSRTRNIYHLTCPLKIRYTFTSWRYSHFLVTFQLTHHYECHNHLLLFANNGSQNTDSYQNWRPLSSQQVIATIGAFFLYIYI